MRLLQQEVEEFIAAHLREDPVTIDQFIDVDDLRAWMSGHVRAPVEPSEEMIDAGCKQHECQQQDTWYSNDELSEHDCKAIYKAMINAHKETI